MVLVQPMLDSTAMAPLISAEKARPLREARQGASPHRRTCPMAGCHSPHRDNRKTARFILKVYQFVATKCVAAVRQRRLWTPCSAS